MLFSWLKRKAEKLNYWRGQDTTDAKTNAKPKPGPARKLTVKEEFILVLIRLRRGFDVEVLFWITFLKQKQNFYNMDQFSLSGTEIYYSMAYQGTSESNTYKTVRAFS